MRKPLLALAVALTLGGAQAAEPPANTDRDVVTAGANAFGVDLYRDLASKDGANLFISPTSISTALAMVYAGANGQTAADIAKTMHYDLPADRFHAASGDLLKSMQIKAEGRRLAVANALWVEKSYVLSPAYLALTEKHYGAGVKKMDFSKPTQAVGTINKWVSDNTEQKIKNLFSPSDVTAATRLVLTNTVYLKADWADPFKKSATHDAPFHLSGDKSVTAPMMSQQRRYLYAKADGAQMLSIPYQGDELSFVIVLPDAADGLGAIEKTLSPAQVSSWQSALKSGGGALVNLQMPRLKFEAKYPLEEPLTKLGMAKAFSNQADFSGMSPKGDLKIDKVVHQTYLAVDETGTEAAAATGAIMATAAMRPDTPIKFHADHPFLFWIEDKRSGAILFMGRVTDPAA